MFRLLMHFIFKIHLFYQCYFSQVFQKSSTYNFRLIVLLQQHSLKVLQNALSYYYSAENHISRLHLKSVNITFRGFCPYVFPLIRSQTLVNFQQTKKKHSMAQFLLFLTHFIFFCYTLCELFFLGFNITFVRHVVFNLCSRYAFCNFQ